MQARLSYSLLGPLDHLRRAIYADDSPLRSDFLSSQDDVYAATASEIYNHIARPNVCETLRLRHDGLTGPIV